MPKHEASSCSKHATQEHPGKQKRSFRQHSSVRLIKSGADLLRNFDLQLRKRLYTGKTPSKIHTTTQPLLHEADQPLYRKATQARIDLHRP